MGGDIFGPGCFFRRQNAGGPIRLRGRFGCHYTNLADDEQSARSEGAWAVGVRKTLYGFFVI